MLTSASKIAKCKRRIFQTKRCKGYDVAIQNFYSRFPHQIQDLEKEKIAFVVSNNKFHSFSCANNDFNILDDHDKNTNIECENLKYNTYLRGLIERTHDVEDCTNYRYLSYEQLVKVIEKKNNQINDLKLDNCNLKKSNIVLSNSQSDSNKLMRFIANNDIPRVSTMLNVLFRQGHGVNTSLNTRR